MDQEYWKSCGEVDWIAGQGAGKVLRHELQRLVRKRNGGEKTVDRIA